ncbi:MAG: hypothetical protein ABIM40_05640 [Pseudomonadota bacterium]
MKIPAKQITWVTAFLYGMFAVTGQVLVLREWMGLSPDSELSIALGMAFFLLWLFAGNSLSARYLSGRPDAAAALPVALALAAFLLPATLFAVSCAKTLMGLSPFVTLSFGRLLVVSALAFGPLGMAVGLVFPLLIEGIRAHGGETGIYAVYMMESLGSGAGTLCVILLISPLLPPVSLALILSALLLAPGLILQGAGAGPPARRGRRLVAGGLMAMFILLAVTGWADGLTRQVRWGNRPDVRGENSRYGPVEVVKIGDTKSVYVNSRMVYNDYHYDNMDYLYEIARQEKQAPENVLILGSYANEWPPDDEPVNVDFIINDEVLAKTLAGGLNNREVSSNARIHVGDPHRYILETEKRYDVIVLAMDQPIRLSTNVSLSVPFFRQLKGILAEDGLLVIQVASTRHFVSRQRLKFLACIQKSLSLVFPSVRAMPGHTAVFFARQGAVAVEAVVAETGGEPGGGDAMEYLYRMHDPALAGAFTSHLSEMGDEVTANYGFRPTAYLYDWLARLFAESNPLRHVVQNIFRMKKIWLFFLPAVVLLMIGSASKFFDSSLSLVLGVSSIIGFLSFSYELLVLFAFSVIHGELYHSLGVITGTFMLGLALGSGLFRARAPARPARSLTLALALFAAISLALYGLLALGLSHPLLLYPLSGIAGVLTGASFPLLVSLALRSRPADASVPGRVYAMDLLGAAAAALVVGPMGLAVLGVQASGLWLALLAASGCLLILLRFPLGKSG